MDNVEGPQVSASGEASLQIGEMPVEVGFVPRLMKAWTIRGVRHGPPGEAFQVEEIPVPELEPDELLVMVMAAGVNYNGIWASLGEPISPMRYTGYDFHIAGSDASGIVWKVGSAVRQWHVGDEVIICGTQTCGECSACNGLDPMACERQKIWGYETNWGSFAQFTKVRSHQLLTKPRHLTWEEAASYAAGCFTAYRMLVTQGNMQAGDNVLIWGGAGGLGTMAIQLACLYGANAIAVVSNKEREEACLKLGAKGVINRLEFQCWNSTQPQTPAEEKLQIAEMKRFGGAIRKITGGKDPDIVFEHSGQNTFAVSLFVANRFGRIVICGATTGFHLNFDARYLWMRQKTIYGSHNANLYESQRANQLVMEQKIAPVIAKVFPFDQLIQAHQTLLENRHIGKLVVLVQAPRSGTGKQPLS